MATDRELLIDIPTTFYAGQIVVRPHTDLDAPAVYEAVKDSITDLKPWMPWHENHRTVDDTLAYIRRAQAEWILRTDFHMGIYLLENGEFLGGIGLHARDWRIPAFEMGYWLRPTAQGKGHIGEAARVLRTFVFEGLQAQRLFIRCDARNQRSARVAERLGCTLEGRLRRSTLDTSGQPCDTLIYALTPEDYTEIQRQHIDEQRIAS